MKRSAPQNAAGGDAKRAKPPKFLDEHNFKIQYQRCPRVVIQHVSQAVALPKPPGFLEGNIIRHFPTKDNRRCLHARFTALGPKAETMQFEVVLGGDAHVLDSLDIKDGEDFRISMKGAAVVLQVQQAQADRPTRQLHFLSGFHIKWNGKTINTWEAKQVRPQQEAATKAEEQVRNQSVAGLSKKKQRELEKRRKGAGNSSGTKVESKNSSLQNKIPPDTVKDEVISQPLPTTQQASTSGHNPIQPNKTEDLVVPAENQEPANQETRYKALLAKKGYKSVKFARMLATPSTVFNVIGVVVVVNESSQAALGDKDWKRTIEIADLTTISESDALRVEGLRINLFSPKLTSLPNPKIGDIIFLHSLKTDRQGYGPAVGYSDRFSWALYSAENQNFHHGDAEQPPIPVTQFSNHASKKDIFLYPSPTDIEIGSALKEWWDELKLLQQAELEKSRVVDPRASVTLGSDVRIHRLIGDTRPDTKPQGYFDCTVEILHKFQDSQGHLNVYVTDYSLNTDITPLDAQWCSKSLAPYVFKIEMWKGDVAEAGMERLEIGKFYFLKNVRMKMSNGGCIEGKFQNVNDLITFDPETSTNQEFKELLQRKAVYEAKHEDRDTFEDKVLGDVVIDRMFNCVVEVLEVDRRGNSAALIVTDYTKMIHSINIDRPSTKGLEGMVVLIELRDRQATIAQAIKPGTFCSLRSLRLKARGGKVEGYLGGSEELIRPMNPTNISLRDLRERKASIKQASSSKSNSPGHLPSSLFKDIDAMRTSLPLPFPRKFRVYAQVLSLKPIKAEDAVVQWCPNCRHEVRRLQALCIECDAEGRDGKLELVSRVVLTVGDRNGIQAYITVPLESLFFSNIDFSNYFGSLTNQNKLEARLNELKPSSEDDSNSPLIPMTLVAWIDDEDQLAFALDHCD